MRFLVIEANRVAGGANLEQPNVGVSCVGACTLAA